MTKKRCLLIGALCFMFLIPTVKSYSQDPITLIIKEAVTKVIRAVDLKIQRLQNETIWLQNAQKQIENTMAKLKLDEISDWVEKQRVLYDDYFEELQKVKAVLSYYHKVRDIMELQSALVRDYHRAIAAIRNDEHFNSSEIQHMEKTYVGILQTSLKNLDALSLIIESFTTQMSDAERLKFIDEIASRMEEHYYDLKRLHNQNASLSLLRSRDAQELKVVEALYGLN